MSAEAAVAARLPHVELALAGDYVRLGEPFVITVRVSNPPDATGVLHVVGAESRQPHVAVDEDLVMPNEAIAPGETLVISVPVTASELEVVALDQIFLELREHDRPVPLAGYGREVAVKPSLHAELQPTLEGLVRYPDGTTKVRLTLQPPRHPAITRLDLAVVDGAQLRAGKSRALLSPVPLAPWEAEWVVSGDVVVLSIRARVTSGDDVEERFPLEVPTPTGRWERPFTFLDPKDLTKHDVVLRTIGRDEKEIKRGFDQVYNVQSGTTVELQIKPRTPDLNAEVTLDAVAGRIRVRPQEDRPNLPGWAVFHLDLEPTRTIWYQRERLPYRVDSAQSATLGEIHFSIGPELGRRWRWASALGFAFTVNALVEAYRVYAEPGGFSALSAEDPLRLLELLGVFSIPIIAAGSWFVGRLLRRFQRR